MNLIDRKSKINFLHIVFYAIFFIATIELTSWVALKVYRAIKPSAINEKLVSKDVMLELAESQRMQLFPTRWYSNKTNYQGKFVTTDESGFRINKTSQNKSYKVAFFGGSTMFSVITEQGGTIPNQINQDYFDALNFGVGGYSTTAELPTLIEALRKYEGIKAAVFYDGVNEIGRKIEELQDAPLNVNFDKVGYYYPAGVSDAVHNSYPEYIKFPQSSFIEIISRLLQFFPNTQKKLVAPDLNLVAENIIDLYFANIADIEIFAKAKGVVPYFIWQPNIFTTKKMLTDREKEIISRDKSLVAHIAPIVQKKLMLDPRFKKYKIIDLSNSFDNSNLEIFYDWCHVTSEGNGIIAKRVDVILKGSSGLQ